jgi:hypothetical protein
MAPTIEIGDGKTIRVTKTKTGYRVQIASEVIDLTGHSMRTIRDFFDAAEYAAKNSLGLPEGQIEK